MTMTEEKRPGEPSGQDLVEQLTASGQLDALFAQIDAGRVELTGDGGFVPAEDVKQSETRLVRRSV